jgi:hypothetical protein
MTLPPCWKVRLVIGGAIVHLLSKTEPVPVIESGFLTNCRLSLIEGTNHGDSLGFIRWASVDALSWRMAPGPEPIE